MVGALRLVEFRQRLPRIGLPESTRPGADIKLKPGVPEVIPLTNSIILGTESFVFEWVDMPEEEPAAAAEVCVPWPGMPGPLCPTAPVPARRDGQPGPTVPYAPPTLDVVAAHGAAADELEQEDSLEATLPFPGANADSSLLGTALGGREQDLDVDDDLAPTIPFSHDECSLPPTIPFHPEDALPTPTGTGGTPAPVHAAASTALQGLNVSVISDASEELLPAAAALKLSDNQHVAPQVDEGGVAGSDEGDSGSRDSASGSGEGFAQESSSPAPAKETTSRPLRSRRTRARRGAKEQEQVRVCVTHMEVTRKIRRDVAKLGGTLVSDPAKATHLVSDALQRTVKFLCALQRTPHIVGAGWLDLSVAAGSWLDPTSPDHAELCQLKDTKQEKALGVRLAEVLDRRQQSPGLLFDGWVAHILPGAAELPGPSVADLRTMLQAAGAVVRKSAPAASKAGGGQVLIIGSSADVASLSETVKGKLQHPVVQPAWVVEALFRLQFPWDMHDLLAGDVPAPAPAARGTKRRSKRATAPAAKRSRK